MARPQALLASAAAIGLVVAVIPAGGVAADPADGVVTTIGSVRFEADFTHPLPSGPGTVVTDDTLRDDLYRLVDETPAGATIRMGVFNLTGNQDVVDSLLDAHDRGVDVFVAHSGYDQSTEALALRSGLGSARHRWCAKTSSSGTPNRACISTHPNGAMHAKFAFFSQTRDKTGALRDDVIWISSANMSENSGARTFNNSLIVYGDEDLYTKMVAGAWTPIWTQQTYPNNDFYAAPNRGYFKSDETAMTVYMSPEQDMDLIARRLQDAVPGPGCEVRLMHNRFTSDRPQVANELVRLKNGGCDVRVMAFDDDGSPRISPSIRTQLQNAGIPIRRTLVHDKTIMTRSRFGTSQDLRYIVWSGSQNLNLGSLTQHEELFTKVESEDIYDGYLQHWNNAWAVAHS